jgi:hypothetical protein
LRAIVENHGLIIIPLVPGAPFTIPGAKFAYYAGVGWKSASIYDIPRLFARPLGPIKPLF